MIDSKQILNELLVWQRNTETTTRQLARELNISRTCLTDYLNKKRNPPALVMGKIILFMDLQKRRKKYCDNK